MYLIPFYDYYVVRDVARSRPEFNALRKHPKIHDYIKAMREFNKSMKKEAE